MFALCNHRIIPFLKKASNMLQSSLLFQTKDSTYMKVKVKFIYKVHDEVLYQEFINGKCGSKERAITLDLIDLPKHMRQQLLDLSEICQSSSYCEKAMDLIWHNGEPHHCIRVWLSGFENIDAAGENMMPPDFEIATLDHVIKSQEEVEDRLSQMVVKLAKNCPTT